MFDDERQCPNCHQTFAATGTMHGQPAALWLLLEHMSEEAQHVS